MLHKPVQIDGAVYCDAFCAVGAAADRSMDEGRATVGAMDPVDPKTLPIYWQCAGCDSLHSNPTGTDPIEYERDAPHCNGTMCQWEKECDCDCPPCNS